VEILTHNQQAKDCLGYVQKMLKTIVIYVSNIPELYLMHSVVLLIDTGTAR